MDVIDEMYEPFDEMKTKFQEAILRLLSIQNIKLLNVNFCCDDNETRFLLQMSNDLKQMFPHISNKDICIAIIYEYYALNLSEQSEFTLPNDIYQRSDIYGFSANNVANVNYLIMFITSNENRLASAIRRHMMGVFGGKKTKKAKRSRRSKQIRKSRKTRKNRRSKRRNK